MFQGIQTYILALVDFYKKDRLAERASSLAYYTMVALTPLIFFSIFLIGVFLGPGIFESKIIIFLEETLGEQVSTLFATLFQNISALDGKLLASLIGVGFIIIGVGNLSHAIRISFVEVFHRDPLGTLPERGVVQQTIISRILSFFWLLALLILVVVLISLHTVISFLFSPEAGWVWLPDLLRYVASPLFSLALLYIFFGVFYRMASERALSWRSAFWAGFWVSTILTILNSLFSLVLSASATLETYGVAGSLVAFILWVYYVMLTLLLGAEIGKMIQETEPE